MHVFRYHEKKDEMSVHLNVKSDFAQCCMTRHMDTEMLEDHLKVLVERFSTNDNLFYAYDLPTRCEYSKTRVGMPVRLAHNSLDGLLRKLDDVYKPFILSTITPLYPDDKGNALGFACLYFYLDVDSPPNHKIRKAYIHATRKNKIGNMLKV